MTGTSVARTVNLEAKSGTWTPYAKSLRARLMVDRGIGFVAAALLLREKNKFDQVVLHLLCQGLEIFIKGVLLTNNYDLHKPKLRRYGHDLLKLVIIAKQEFGLNELRAVEKKNWQR